MKGTECFHSIPDRCSYRIIRIVYKCEGGASDDSTEDRRAETELEPRVYKHFLHLWRSSTRNNYETVGPFVIISNAERESESHLELAC